MKRLPIIITLGAFTVVFASSCKKCQECTTTTSQNVMGFDQSTNTVTEYCGDDYNNAPEEGTVNQVVGGISQTVTTSCVEK